MARLVVALFMLVSVLVLGALLLVSQRAPGAGRPGSPSQNPTTIPTTDQPDVGPERATVGEPSEPAPAAEESPREPAERTAELSDDFEGETLSEEKWAVTRQHDFAEFAVDLTGAEDAEGAGRLRLRCGTRGTDDQTVKALGVVSRQRLDLRGRKRLSLDFDWNGQENGCYLTGAVYFCPTLTTKNPAEEPQWLRLEYVGVPPGKNARLAIWLKDRRTPKWIYDEGWPKEQKTGRLVGALQLAVQFQDGQWTVLEDGKELFQSREQWNLPFEEAHLYLQMTSHSNYPPRELFFDHVRFKPLAAEEAQTEE